MRIGVVGSGIAGLSTAALLRRVGHSVDLLERSAAPRPLGAGLFLQPPGAAILAEIGGLSLLSRSASRITRIDSKTTAGARLIDVDYARVDPGLCAFGLTRPAIWNALFEPAVKAGVTVKAGVEVIAADNCDDHAVLTFRSGQSQSYDFVVLACGTHAAVLPAGLRRRSRLYPWGCLWTTVEIPDDWPDDTLIQRCEGTQVMVGVLPTGRAEGRRVAAIYWSIRNDAVAAWRETPLQSWKDAVRRVWPDAGDLVESLRARGFSAGNLPRCLGVASLCRTRSPAARDSVELGGARPPGIGEAAQADDGCQGKGVTVDQYGHGAERSQRRVVADPPVQSDVPGKAARHREIAAEDDEHHSVSDASRLPDQRRRGKLAGDGIRRAKACNGFAFDIGIGTRSVGGRLAKVIFDLGADPTRQGRIEPQLTGKRREIVPDQVSLLHVEVPRGAHRRRRRSGARARAAPRAPSFRAP